MEKEERNKEVTEWRQRCRYEPLFGYSLLLVTWIQSFEAIPAIFGTCDTEGDQITTAEEHRASKENEEALFHGKFDVVGNATSGFKI